MTRLLTFFFFFFFNDTATTEIYTLSLHDALPIFPSGLPHLQIPRFRTDLIHGLLGPAFTIAMLGAIESLMSRSEEHTSELQSRQYLVCRLLLEKKKKHDGSVYYVTAAVDSSPLAT